MPREILYDNMKTVVLQRNAYGAGIHRFHAGLWHLAKQAGFTPRLCQPNRAQTKGKIERFIRYLRYSFYLPLVSQLQQVGLNLDIETANIEVRKWLRDVAHVRVHQTTQEMPLQRFKQELAFLQPYTVPQTITHSPFKDMSNTTLHCYEQLNLQHSLSVYDALLTEYI